MIVVVIIFILFIIIIILNRRRRSFENIFENRNSCCILTYKKTNKIHTILLNLDKQNYENDDVRLEYSNFDRSFQIKNISTNKIRIISVEILICKIDDNITHIFQNGYQSWSPSYLTEIDSTQRYTSNIPIISHFINLGTNLHHNKSSKYWGFNNVLISNMFTTITDLKETTLFGFADYHDMCGEFVLINKEYLIAYEDYNKLLDIGEILSTSKIIEIKGDNNVLDIFASKIYNYSSKNIEIPTGWCSWYENGVNINEKKIISNINRINDSKLPIKYIQIDDGYVKNIGDWLEHDDEKFPNGLSKIVKMIKSKKYEAGIWLSPFLVSKTSNIMKKHPDWILKDECDKMVFATFNNVWKGKYTYSLDLTHPDVKKYIFRIFKTLKNIGFTYFKLDFLCAGMLNGSFYDSSLNRVEIYRNALKIIRDAVTIDCYILGCGAPLSASIGLVDGMRISPDTDYCWNPPFLARTFADGVGIPCIKYQLENIISRKFMHKKWWINDPDVVLLSSKVKYEEFMKQIEIISESGGSIFFSDNLEKVTNERIEVLKTKLLQLDRVI